MKEQIAPAPTVDIVVPKAPKGKKLRGRARKEAEAAAAKAAALAAEQQGKGPTPLELEDLNAIHQDSVEAAQALFRKIVMDTDDSGAYFAKIAHETGRLFEKIKKDNEAACQTFCEETLRKLAVSVGVTVFVIFCYPLHLERVVASWVKK